jgi:hypothetical protein
MGTVPVASRVEFAVDCPRGPLPNISHGHALSTLDPRVADQSVLASGEDAERSPAENSRKRKAVEHVIEVLDDDEECAETLVDLANASLFADTIADTVLE